MPVVTPFWTLIVERLQRKFPTYLVVPNSFVPAIESHELTPWEPVSQDPGRRVFQPKTSPERLTNPADASVSYPYTFRFDDQLVRTWEVMYGVDWGQTINTMTIPPMLDGAPSVKLTLSETKPLTVPGPKQTYEGTRDISIGPRTSIMVTAGVSAISPAAEWRGELRLVGGLTYTLQRPNGELLTPTHPVPLDYFFAGDPHPNVQVHGPRTVGIHVDIRYSAYQPADRPDVLVEPQAAFEHRPRAA